jgi:hypothetical protein
MANELQQIPNKWKAAVRSILQRSAKNSIITSGRARLEWESAFPFSFPYERNDAISKVLGDPLLKGKHITGMTEAGEVWEFFAFYEQRKVYIKINLLPNGKVIILYSAHIPNKGDQL